VNEQPRLDLDWIYERYHPRVVAYAAKLLGRDNAEDVAHEVFLKIDRALPTLADPSKLTSWIYAITANAVRDAARSRAAWTSRLATAPLAGDSGEDAFDRLPDTAARSAEASIARDEMVACFLDYVERLPTNYHDVYVMSVLEELPMADIARRLSISVGAAKIRLHRARALLFGQLRTECRCYYDEYGDLMGAPKTSGDLSRSSRMS